jgi:hypothetical protein
VRGKKRADGKVRENARIPEDQPKSTAHEPGGTAGGAAKVSGKAES